MSKAETILTALAALLTTTGLAVYRNPAESITVPAGAIIVLRDGDPGEPERMLGFPDCFYRHEIDIEIYAADGNAATRDNEYDDALTAIDIALRSDATLGGLVQVMEYARPSAGVDLTEGGGDIKQGIMNLIVEYQTSTPLS